MKCVSMSFLFEYVWLDFDGGLRSKIKVCYRDIPPIWNFDGSSTGQMVSGTNTSDVIINPIRTYNHPLIDYPNSKLVLCECLNPDMTPHNTNHRRQCDELTNIVKEEECLFGIEQEYVIMQRDGTPYEWKSMADPGVGGQGPYYCAVGGDRAFGRNISEEHLLCCLKAGVHICGTNAEVMPSQWEFQIGTCDMLTVSDDLHVARFLLQRITEKYKCSVSFYPKLFPNWNGSGGHTNFSTKNMRDTNGMQYILQACDKLAITHLKDIQVYGADNDKRLTGLHETSSMHTFTWGKQDRNCSVRIPLQVCMDRCGYLEDRRPASNMDPYLVVHSIVKSILFH